jgi:hypothetical protein
MRFSKILLIGLLIIIFVQFIVIGLLMIRNQDTKIITDFISYEKDRKLYLVNNENNENIIWVWFNDDGTLHQCYVDDRNGIRASVLISDNINAVLLQNLAFQIQSVQYFSLMAEILLDRQETVGAFTRHSQIFNDGSMQQRKRNDNKRDWEIELPVNGEWKKTSHFLEIE